MLSAQEGRAASGAAREAAAGSGVSRANLLKRLAAQGRKSFRRSARSANGACKGTRLSAGAL